MHYNAITASPGIRLYRRQDYPLIARWYEARGRKAPNKAMLSDMGFIVDNRVAGFLYTTNSSIAMIEGVIAAPDTVPSLRRASLKKLCSLLVDSAIAMGYSDVIAMTAHPSIEKICTELGFKQHSLTMFSYHESDDDDVTTDYADN